MAINLWLGLYRSPAEWPWTYFFLMVIQIMFRVHRPVLLDYIRDRAQTERLSNRRFQIDCVPRDWVRPGFDFDVSRLRLVH
jgi:hypothetical protein